MGSNISKRRRPESNSTNIQPADNHRKSKRFFRFLNKKSEKPVAQKEPENDQKDPEVEDDGTPSYCSVLLDEVNSDIANINDLTDFAEWKYLQRNVFDEDPGWYPVPYKTSEEVEEILKKVDTEPEPSMLVGADKVMAWAEKIWPTVTEPTHPLISTVGLTPSQQYVLSNVIHEVTRPGEPFQMGYVEQNGFVMVHQTNEKEIMEEIGGFRLNPWLKVITDIDVHDRQSTKLVIPLNELKHQISEERYRRGDRLSRNPPTYDSLTLEQAYVIGFGEKWPENREEWFIESFIAKIFDKIKHKTEIPIVYTHKPVIGVPFKALYRNTYEYPEISMDNMRSMNQYLDRYGLQIIDLRYRIENIHMDVPVSYRMHNSTSKIILAIEQSLEVLHELRNTARYFAVHTFFVQFYPLRALQAIVRFKPGLPIDPVDWVKTKESRFELIEPDLRTVRYPDDIYYPAKVILAQRSADLTRTEFTPYWDKFEEAEKLAELKTKEEEEMLQKEKERREKEKKKLEEIGFFARCMLNVCRFLSISSPSTPDPPKRSSRSASCRPKSSSRSTSSKARSCSAASKRTRTLPSAPPKSNKPSCSNPNPPPVATVASAAYSNGGFESSVIIPNN